MKQRSLKTKLLLLTLGLFLASGVAMTWIQSSSLNGLRDDIMAQTRGALEQEVSRSLQFQAERYAVQIEDQLQQAYQIPLGMAAQLEGSMAQPVRIPVKLNSDSGICEHHFRKVCGQGFFEQKLSFEGRHLFDSLNKPAAKRSAAVVDPRRWNRTVHLTSEYVH